ncbi:hypothetical protein BJY04DRAFT_226020 [Aspergillus karnatakaensis]|uniref:uncharacterized protein n=1 Tax=Aspergillus karnatakaensis TaxID=1810916 RepID=UPI003CCCFC56
MADEEERLKAEKLAAAKKRVAQLQKKKKGKKATSSETPKEAEASETPAAQGGAEEAERTPETEAAAATTETETETEKQAEDELTQLELDPEPATEPEKSQEAEGDDATEPMPDIPPTTESPFQETETEPSTGNSTLSPRAGHTRQPSLSIQSKMRSSSFRKSSVSQGSAPSVSPSATLKSPSLPPLSADGEAVQEVYRKQSSRIEELERENKRLEKEVEEVSGRFKKTEDQLEELREAGVDAAELKERLRAAEERVGGVEELKAEIASLQRQNSHLQTRTHRNNASVSVPGASESPPSDLAQQLESKSAAVEAMELEISNLRAQVSTQSTQETQILALEEKLSQTEASLEKSQRELTDAKAAITRASEKAVKEGVDKTSSETLIKSLQREIEELKQEKTESEKKIDTLEKKLQALSNLHKESETRHQARLRESDKFEKEAAVLRKKLASAENENLRLKEEQETLRKRHAGTEGGADDDALDELEDEERSRLQRRIRDLEGEVFDLRRGVWQEKRHELQSNDEYSPEYSSPSANPAAVNTFDDVDLVGGSPEHTRRRSMAQNQRQNQQQQHSSFSTVLSSGIAAFYPRSSTPSQTHPQSQHHAAGQGTRGSLELLSEENFDDEFDEAEFARAQAEEEARKRVEWVRGIKSQLKEWKGWRLDLVDSRAGAEGAGVGMGGVFEI